MGKEGFPATIELVFANGAILSSENFLWLGPGKKDKIQQFKEVVAGLKEAGIDIQEGDWEKHFQ